jgi:hypothetical protein
VQKGVDAAHAAGTVAPSPTIERVENGGVSPDRMAGERPTKPTAGDKKAAARDVTSLKREPIVAERPPAEKTREAKPTLRKAKPARTGTDSDFFRTMGDD